MVPEDDYVQIEEIINKHDEWLKIFKENLDLFKKLIKDKKFKNYEFNLDLIYNCDKNEFINIYLNLNILGETKFKIPGAFVEKALKDDDSIDNKYTKSISTLFSKYLFMSTLDYALKDTKAFISKNEYGKGFEIKADFSETDEPYATVTTITIDSPFLSAKENYTDLATIFIERNNFGLSNWPLINELLFDLTNKKAVDPYYLKINTLEEDTNISRIRTKDLEKQKN